MPPKKKRSVEAEALGQQAYQVIADGAGSDEVLFTESVCAFLDQADGRATEALGFPVNMTAVPQPHEGVLGAATILASLRSSMTGRLSTNGPRSTEERTQVQSIAAALHSDRLTRDCARLVTGIPRKSWNSGANLARHNEAAGAGGQRSNLRMKEHSDHVPWRRVWEWFHSAPGVEVNKQTKRTYRRRRFALPDGKIIHLTCEHRQRHCSVSALAQSFLESSLFKELMQENSQYSISARKAAACICDCIKEVKDVKCVCPYCVSLKYKLEAWDKLRTEAAANGETCGCGCQQKDSQWAAASTSLSALREATTCGKVHRCVHLHTRTNARMHSTHPRTHIHTPGTISRPGTTQRPVEHAKVQQTRVFFEAGNAQGTQRSSGVYIPRVHYAVRGMRLGQSGAWRLPNYGQ